MREIKFRVWDKSDRRMIYDCKELDSAMTDYDILINLKGEIFLGADHCSDCCRLHVDRDDPTEDYIIMQYTGLKDKNGKEIYEGDVLKLQYKKAHPNIIVIRNYIEDTFHLEDELGWGDTRCIVIGNIYENPDLLEK